MSATSEPAGSSAAAAGRSDTDHVDETDTVQSLLAEIIHWQAKTALMKKRKRLLLEELYFATLECEDEPRKKKKGDLFTGAEVVLKAPIEPQSSKEDKLAN